jgi:hypothetical protein
MSTLLWLVAKVLCFGEANPQRGAHRNAVWLLWLRQINALCNADWRSHPLRGAGWLLWLRFAVRSSLASLASPNQIKSNQIKSNQSEAELAERSEVHLPGLLA